MGYAWVYRKYAKDKSLYALEDTARAAGRGLWASDGAIPPWEWRRRDTRHGNVREPLRRPHRTMPAVANDTAGKCPHAQRHGST